MSRHQHARPRQLRWGRVFGTLIVVGAAIGFAGWLHHQARPAPKAEAPVAESAVSRVPSAKSSGQAAKPKATAVGRQLQAQLTPLSFNGTAVIIRNGRVAGSYTHGVANLATGAANSLNTMYEIDSVQKVMTAVLIMHQIRAGKLSMTTTMARFYPKLPNAKSITVRNLLDMTSGLAYKPGFRAAAYHSDWQVATHAAANVVVTDRGFGNWTYSGANFVLLSGILVKLTGRTYQQLFTQTFTTPLHLRHTRFAYLPRVPAMATGYAWNLQTLQPKAPYRTTAAAAHGELGTGQVYMTAGDLYRVEAAIQAGKFLTAAEKAVLFTPGSVSKYGGGLYHYPNDDAANGYGYGFQTHLRISHDGRSAVILMANAGPGKAVLTVAARLTAQYVY